MALQAFLDDSRTDEGQFYVLAGYIASPETWAQFSRDWEERLPLAVVQDDGRYRFKMSEMARFNRMENVPAFYNLIARHLRTSVSCILDVAALHRALDDLSADVLLDTGQEVPVDLGDYHQRRSNPFFIAFRALMDTFHNSVARQPDLLPVGEVVDFYFDDTSDKKAIRESWDEYLKSKPEDVRATFGREPVFEDDEEFLPLQAADFRAWWVRMWAEELGALNIRDGSYPFPTTDGHFDHIYMVMDEHLVREFVVKDAAATIAASAQNGQLEFRLRPR